MDQSVTHVSGIERNHVPGTDPKGLAEREGFEPPIRLPVCRISSAVHSTALPPLHPAFALGGARNRFGTRRERTCRRLRKVRRDAVRAMGTDRRRYTAWRPQGRCEDAGRSAEPHRRRYRIEDSLARTGKSWRSATPNKALAWQSDGRVKRLRGIRTAPGALSSAVADPFARDERLEDGPAGR